MMLLFSPYLITRRCLSVEKELEAKQWLRQREQQLKEKRLQREQLQRERAWAKQKEKWDLERAKDEAERQQLLNNMRDLEV